MRSNQFSLRSFPTLRILFLALASVLALLPGASTQAQLDRAVLELAEEQAFKAATVAASPAPLSTEPASTDATAEDN